jgi:DeoR/GlpR family transcriptional regulator of sugar metabolism
MISSAKEVIVLADSTKFGHVAFAQIASFNEVDKLVTDVEPSDNILKKLTDNGVKVIIAD